MQKSVVFDLEQSKKRLNYFNLLKEKQGTSLSLTKWIQIYSERTQKLEARMQEMQEFTKRSETPKA